MINGIYPVVMPEETTELIRKMASLDEKGLHTVATVLEVESLRCKAETNAEAQSAPLSYPIIDEKDIPSTEAMKDLAGAND